MKITICDICGERSTHALTLETGETHTDIAGGQAEKEYKYYDLCPDDFAWLLTEYLHKDTFRQLEMIGLINFRIDSRGK